MRVQCGSNVVRNDSQAVPQPLGMPLEPRCSPCRRRGPNKPQKALILGQLGTKRGPRRGRDGAKKAGFQNLPGTTWDPRDECLRPRFRVDFGPFRPPTRGVLKREKNRCS